MTTRAGAGGARKGRPRLQAFGSCGELLAYLVPHAHEVGAADEQLAKELVERARSEGAALVGPGGLLTGLTKTALETAL
jgi:hypothetical protein